MGEIGRCLVSDYLVSDGNVTAPSFSSLVSEIDPKRRKAKLGGFLETLPSIRFSNRVPWALERDGWSEGWIGSSYFRHIFLLIFVIPSWIS